MASYREPGSDNPFTLLLEEAMNSNLRGLMVSLPGHVTAFDPARQRAQVQAGIKRIINGEAVDFTIMSNVPVQFSGDSEWYFWHQITPGQTEGVLHFSQRAIDTWKERGGSTAPVDFRMFDANDAYFAPGYRSNPGVIPNFENDGCGMSNYSGSVRLSLNDSGLTVNAGGSTLTLSDSGFNVDSSSFTHNGTNVGDDHSHPQGPDSDNNSQQNTGGPI